MGRLVYIFGNLLVSNLIPAAGSFVTSQSNWTRLAADWERVKSWALAKGASTFAAVGRHYILWAWPGYSCRGTPHIQRNGAAQKER